MTSTQSDQHSNQFTSQQVVIEPGLTTVIVPVIAEQLHVDKQLIETGQVRILKTVREDEQVVDLPLIRETVEVERVAIGQPVAEAPGVRQEGNTTIYPVLKEVVVVEKRLMLVEEIRVTVRQTTVHDPQTVTTRHEEVSVERSALNETRERSAPQNGSSL